MKIRPTPSLRTQFAAAMIVAILIAILFGYIALRLFVEEQRRSAIWSLGPVAQRTVQALQHGQHSSAPDITTLYRESMAAYQRIDDEQDHMLIVLAAIACCVGVGVGLTFARRFTRPIEEIGMAARRIASGDLAARASSPRPGAGELSVLFNDFNVMADALERSDRRTREDSAAIAHELRTPLTILRGRLQGYADGVFQPDPDDVRGLTEQVDLLTRIVEDLQMLSVAQSHRLDLQKVPVALDRLAALLLQTLEPMLRDKNIQVQRDLAPATAMADHQRLAQVLLALIDNAMRHAGSGSSITVATSSRDGQAVLNVSDRGPGLDDDQIAQMFVPFWRGEGSRNRALGGSGLGLAVVKAIVDAHGGTIIVARRHGGGLSFDVCLPACPG